MIIDGKHCALVWTWDNDSPHECRLLEGHDGQCACACGTGFWDWMHGTAMIHGKGIAGHREALAFLRRMEESRRRKAIRG